jgi:hypothetical protein
MVLDSPEGRQRGRGTLDLTGIARALASVRGNPGPWMTGGTSGDAGGIS